jgi:hypothetical protein
MTAAAMEELPLSAVEEVGEHGLADCPAWGGTMTPL